jgi:hypothetical protein
MLITTVYIFKKFYGRNSNKYKLFTRTHAHTQGVVALDCLVVACLPLDSRIATSNPAVDNGLLRASVPCPKIYGVFKNTSMKKILCRQNSAAISRQVPPVSLPVVDISAGNCQTALVDESGMITISGVAVRGSPCPPPRLTQGIT